MNPVSINHLPRTENEFKEFTDLSLIELRAILSDKSIQIKNRAKAIEIMDKVIYGNSEEEIDKFLYSKILNLKVMNPQNEYILLMLVNTIQFIMKLGKSNFDMDYINDPKYKIKTIQPLSLELNHSDCRRFSLYL